MLKMHESSGTPMLVCLEAKISWKDMCMATKAFAESRKSDFVQMMRDSFGAAVQGVGVIGKLDNYHFKLILKDRVEESRLPTKYHDIPVVIELTGKAKNRMGKKPPEPVLVS